MVYPNPQIYHHLETIFVHVPKTAGTAIERALTLRREDVVGGHTTALGYMYKFPDCFAAYFKFSVVRHPVDRFVSAFAYLKREPVHSALNNQVAHMCDTLDAFVEHLEDSPRTICESVHLLPQHEFVCDKMERIMVDTIYRFEELEDAWMEICKRTGRHWAPLPKVNVSSRASLVIHNPDRLKSLMLRVYRKDFDIFGYDPDQAGIF